MRIPHIALEPNSPRATSRGSTLLGFLLGIGFSLVIAAIVAYFVYSKESPFKVEKNPVLPPVTLPAAKAPETNPSTAGTSVSGTVAAGKTPATSTEPATTPAVAPVQPVPTPTPAADLAKPQAVALPAPRSEPSGTEKGKEAGKENKPLYLQAGAFNQKEDAEARRAQLALMGLEGKITEITKDDKPLYRVRVGPFDSPESASKARGDMARNGIDSVLIR